MWLLPTPFWTPALGKAPPGAVAAPPAWSHPRALPRDADGAAECWASLPSAPCVTRAADGAWERRDLESSLFVATCGESPVLGRTGQDGSSCAVACPRRAGRDAGISGEMPCYSGGQDVKWSRSGLRKPWISKLQHIPNLTLLPTSSFSLPVPSPSILSEKSAFSSAQKPFPIVSRCVRPFRYRLL